VAIRHVVIISYHKQIPTNFTFHFPAQYELFILRGTRGKTNQGGKNDTCFYHLKIKNNLKHSNLITVVPFSKYYLRKIFRQNLSQKLDFFNIVRF